MILSYKVLHKADAQAAVDHASRVYKHGKTAKDEENVRLCFVCHQGGELMLCDHPKCAHGYHVKCVGLSQSPKGKWICPLHSCCVCHADSVRECVGCPRGFCEDHLPKNIALFGKTQRFILCDQCNSQMVSSVLFFCALIQYSYLSQVIALFMKV